MSDNYLTIKEASKVLGVHWQTIRNYIHQEKLPSIKIGRTYRIKRSDIENLNKKMKQIDEKEIEIRFKIRNREKLEDTIRKKGGKLTNHSHIIDHYYCQNNINSMEEVSKFFSNSKGYLVRIREVDNDYSGRITATLEIKKPINGNHNELLEGETLIQSTKELERILELMDMKKYIEIDKERFVYKYKEVKFCIENIENWGTGLEVEMMTTKDYKEAEKIIYQTAQEVGIKKTDEIKPSLTYHAMRKLAKF